MEQSRRQTLGHWTEEIKAGKWSSQGLGDPQITQVHPLPPSQGSSRSSERNNLHAGLQVWYIYIFICIYIYNCSHFIVLYPLFTVDQTQALNNCRERPLGWGECRKTMGSKGKRLRSSQRKTGEGPPMGGVWKLQHQKRSGKLQVGKWRAREKKELKCLYNSRTQEVPHLTFYGHYGDV